MKPNNEKTQKSLLSAPLVMAVVVTACALLLFSTALAGIAQAAKLSFTPGSATVTVAPGEEVAVPLNIELSATSRADAYASFRVLQTFGNLNRAWVSGVSNVLLNAATPTSKNTVRVKVPAGTPMGQFYGKFRTVWLRSNESVAPVEFTLNLNVEEELSCKKAPSVMSVTAEQPVIKAKNNQTQDIIFNGRIDMPENCEDNSAWYVLNDEYAAPNEKKTTFDVNPDGSFTTSVTVETSRKGQDKNGREYTVVFGAGNETGSDPGVTSSIVISHDNRKK